VPNTAAATQPRTSGGRSDSGTSVSDKRTSLWVSSGSTTILEKLRSDFNSSSKNAVDRIAQVRVGINDVPYDMLPRVVPAIPGSYTETSQENENAWADLISKFKSQILSSFDMRVSQYEEDIREKDAQRALPGWNFCTFFVLKEGLARGFESVGLVEDALVGYDELSIGLDAIIKEQSAEESSAGQGGAFRPYTTDLKQQAERALALIRKDSGDSPTDSDVPINMQPEDQPFDDDEIAVSATRKRYRDLILSNDVSIFEFRCYVFARQLSLLLRLGNAWSSREELLAKLQEQRESTLQGVAVRPPASQPTEDSEDLTMLAQVCRRSLEFVSSIAETMREDIRNALLRNQKKADEEKPVTETPEMEQVIENIVSSFTFSFTQQILAQTSTKSLPIPPSTLVPADSKTLMPGQEPKSAIPEPKTMMHPARSSSLTAAMPTTREPPSPNLFPGRRASVPDQGSLAAAPFLKVGLEELAAYRADLYLLSRSVLERFGKEHGWQIGWEQATESGYLDEVDLNAKSQAISSENNPVTHGIASKLLSAALNDSESFYRLYETLTDKALRHYTVASREQSLQTCMADLAVLKFHRGDYSAAASYFYRMTPFYGDGGWEEVEMSMLNMYSKCLKELGREEEYVRVTLKLLSKEASAQRAVNIRKSEFSLGKPRVCGEVQEAKGHLSELMQASATMEQEIAVPMQNWFSGAEVEGSPRYHDGRDGFSLSIRLQYLLIDELEVDKVKVSIVPTTAGQTREIWLENDEPVTCKRGHVRFSVSSNVSTSHAPIHSLLNAARSLFPAHIP
jgi:hypothetical protein